MDIKCICMIKNGFLYENCPDFKACKQALYPEKERPQILQAREKTHGPFSINAHFAQALKRAMMTKDPDVWGSLSPMHQEVLHLICTKLGRILAGDAKFKDHWADIAGYAKLGEEACDD